MRLGSYRRFTPKWWLTLPLTAKDIYRRLTPLDHSITNMSCWWHGELERKPVEVVFSEAAQARYEIINPVVRLPGTSTSLFELNCILLGSRMARSKRVLEIGTFQGNTTLNLAINQPEDGMVVTIDLPIDQHVEYALDISDRHKRNVTDRRVVGEQFQGHAAANRIKQVFGDSARIDFSTLGGPFDFALIDGCHDYNYVKSDTTNVLKVMRPNGIVMWHDYGEMESVSTAVDELQHLFDRMCAIEGTRIAMGSVR